MSTLTFAHGGTAGLIFEIGFLAVPILVFTVMAVVSSRRSRAEEEREEPEAGGSRR
ncbi:MAG TPA: hypothetical protein VHM89_04935 [Acidimicrobiales bacterium]|nr:hypothetical protein [Acidimicrobiales bacterium]